MDNSRTPVQKTARRKFFTWATKWYYDDVAQQEYVTPDVTDVVGLLSSSGFFVRHVTACSPADIKAEASGCRVEVSCAHSGLRVLMESQALCRCSKPESNAHFWTVSGTAPTSSSQTSLHQTEAGSSLLPKVHPAVSEVVKANVSQLVMLMSEPLQKDSQFYKVGKTLVSSTGRLPQVTGLHTNPGQVGPQRHRSLDTLMDHPQDTKLLEPEPLSKDLSYSQFMLEAMDIDAEPLPKLSSTHREDANPSLERQKTWSREDSECGAGTSAGAGSRALPVLPCELGDLQVSFNKASSNLTNTIQLLESIRRTVLVDSSSPPCAAEKKKSKGSGVMKATISGLRAMTTRGASTKSPRPTVSSNLRCKKPANAEPKNTPNPEKRSRVTAIRMEDTGARPAPSRIPAATSRIYGNPPGRMLKGVSGAAAASPNTRFKAKKSI